MKIKTQDHRTDRDIINIYELVGRLKIRSLVSDDETLKDIVKNLDQKVNSLLPF